MYYFFIHSPSSHRTLLHSFITFNLGFPRDWKEIVFIILKDMYVNTYII